MADKTSRLAVNIKIGLAYLVLLALCLVAAFLIYDMWHKGLMNKKVIAPVAKTGQEQTRDKLTQPDAALLTAIRNLKGIKEDTQPVAAETASVPAPIVGEERGPLASTLNLAISLYKDRDYKQSFELLNSVVERDPVSVEAREASLYLAFIFQRRGDLLAAIEAIKRAYALAKDDPVINYNYGMLLYEAKDFRAALEKFEVACEKAPGTMMYHRAAGKGYFQMENFDRAFVHFSEAIKLQKDDPELLYYHGVCARQSKSREDMAIASLERVTTLASNHEYTGKAYENLSELYRGRGDLDKAIATLKRAITARPADQQLLFNLGVLYIETKEFDPALSCFERVTSLKPGDAAAWENIAGLYFRKGNYHKALAAAVQVLSLKPDNVGMTLLRAYILDSLGRYEEAITIYKKVISLNPQSAEARKSFLNLGVIAERKGNLLQAVEYYLQADDQDPLKHYNLGIIYERQGVFEKAVTAYQKAIDLDNKNADLKFSLAKLLFRIGMNEEAERELGKSRELGRDDFEMWMLTAEVYSRLNKNEEALAVYNRLLEKNVSSENIVRVLTNKGILYDRLGQYDRALDMYSVALDKQPSSPDVYHNLGLVYAHKKDFPQAVRMFKKAIQLKPGSEESHLNLADIFFTVGLYEDARREYEKVLELNRSNLEAQLGLRKVRETNL